MLDAQPAELLCALGIGRSDDDLVAAAKLCGGIANLDALSGRNPSATEVACGWKTYLDVARSARPDPSGDAELLVLLLVRRALVIANRDRRTMQGALGGHRLNWFGTWREVNLRTAGRLYAHGLRRSRDSGDGSAGIAMTLAQQCWQVIEPLDDSLSEAQRRNWRGMRGSARLFLARRDAVARDTLLRGAVEDFGIAEQCGDRTPQHFQMLAEANILLFTVDRDDALLTDADAVFERARGNGAESAEVIAQRGELLFVRGTRAQAVADAGDATGTGPDEPPEAPSGFVNHLESHQKTALRAASAAFDASALWYSMAIDQFAQRGLDAEVFCVRRGQSLQRSATTRHRLGKPGGRRLDDALADLCRVEREGAKIRSDYWPRALCAKARQLIRGDDPVSLDEAAELVERARIYAQQFVDAEENVFQRVVRLGREIELRQAIRDEDDASARRVLDDEEFVAVSPVAPLIYAARLLCGVAPSVDDDDRLRVEQIVNRLESTARQSRSGLRVFAASHAGTLLHLTTVSESVDTTDPAVLERVYALFKLADQEASSMQTCYQFARAASRLARRVAKGATVEMHARAVELIGETIGALKSLAVDLDTTCATPTGPQDDWFAPDLVEPESDLGATWFEPKVIASLLGDSHLRRDALSPSREDLDDAITWLQRSIDLGNDSPACLGTLGDAHLRHGKRRRDPVALQRGIDLKTAARERLLAADIDVARENFSASASAAAMIWRITDDPASYDSAADLAMRAEASDPSWPWPLLQLAELAAADVAVRDRLPRDAPHVTTVPAARAATLWMQLRDGCTDALRTEACQRAAANQEFLPKVLGGRSRTYVLQDPHGLLSATLVLKPLDDIAQGQHERRRLTEIGTYLARTESPAWATVPEPVALLDAESNRSAIFVTRRATGRPLSDIVADAVRAGSSVRNHPLVEMALRRTTTMLAMIHAAGPQPANIARITRRTKDSMRKGLCTDLSKLGTTNPKDIAHQWMSLLPDEMTLVTKRDAHTENWLITDSGAVVALDLQAATYLPLGFELAQLIEDMPAFPAHDARSRTELAEAYIEELRTRRPDLTDALPDVRDAGWQSSYACYAARRAIFTLARHRGKGAESSGSERLLGARREHARALLRQTRAIVPELVVFETVLAPTVQGRQEI